MEFIIDSDFHDVRLDKFLRKTYREIPLSGIFRMLRKGKVKVNGKRKKQDYRLQRGDCVRVWEQSAPSSAPPLLELSKEDQHLARSIIVFEDDDIILCNKPSGLVMHEGSDHVYGMTELIRAYTRNQGFNFVHRIDKMTAGLVIGGKNPQTIRKLSQLIREQIVEKQYVVLVEGVVVKEFFLINTFLKKEHDRVVEQIDGKSGGKEARSEFRVLKRGPGRTLLQARLHTGRTHQLRVQLANIGHPIVGDPKYGKAAREETMFLFSQRLVVSPLNIDFSLAIPGSFERALQQ
ncbi:MAG: RluA family pseudouridine synthase [Thermodesulfobacteriota bacterium]